MSDFLQSGYIIRETKTIKESNKEYLIYYYQGDHSNEIKRAEIIDGKHNGIVTVYKYGLLYLKWEERNGQKGGDITVYENGKIAYVQSWDNYFSDEDKVQIVYSANGQYLQITDLNSQKVVYRGGYDGMRRRYGNGFAFNRQTGDLEYCGYFFNDNMVSYKYLFELDKMIEYSTDVRVNEDNLICQPCYIGGYIYDSVGNIVKRNGIGYIIDPKYRTAIQECSYENGKLVKTMDINSDGTMTNVSKEESEDSETIKLKKELELATEQLHKKDIELTALRNEIVQVNIQSANRNDDVNRLRIQLQMKDERIQQLQEDNGREKGLRKQLEQKDKQIEKLKNQLNELNESLKQEDKRSGKKENSFVLFSSMKSLQPMKNTLSNLKIAANSCNGGDWKVLRLSGMPALEKLEIMNDCFMMVQTCTIDGLPQLKSIVIHDNAFTEFKSQGPEYEECDSKEFHLTNCKQLASLTIGRYSFGEWEECELKNLPALTSIKFGCIGNPDKNQSNNFAFSDCIIQSLFSKLLLPDLPNLQNIIFGVSAFEYCSYICIKGIEIVLFLKDLPKLTTIRLGENALAGDLDDFNYDESSEVSTIVMMSNCSREYLTDLPKLQSLISDGDNNFECFAKARIFNIPLLKNIQLTGTAFGRSFICKHDNANHLYNFIKSRNIYVNNNNYYESLF